MRDQGMTLAEIGQRVGVRAQRDWQILERR